VDTKTHNVAPDLADQLRPVGELIPLPGNPRQGDIGAISESLTRFGQQKPVVVNPDGVIIAGNHTYLAAVALGWTHVAAVTTTLEGGEQRGYALADNRLSDLASYDLRALQEALEEAGDLTGTGYDASDMDDLLAVLDAPNPTLHGRTTINELADSYQASGFRSIVLMYEGDEFQRMVARLAELAKEMGVASNAEVVAKLAGF
jgi:ParB-like chromosome segregation protein Spo0J